MPRESLAAAGMTIGSARSVALVLGIARALAVGERCRRVGLVQSPRIIPLERGHTLTRSTSKA